MPCCLWTAPRRRLRWRRCNTRCRHRRCPHRACNLERRAPPQAPVSHLYGMYRLSPSWPNTGRFMSPCTAITANFGAGVQPTCLRAAFDMLFLAQRRGGALSVLHHRSDRPASSGGRPADHPHSKAELEGLEQSFAERLSMQLLPPGSIRLRAWLPGCGCQPSTSGRPACWIPAAARATGTRPACGGVRPTQAGSRDDIPTTHSAWRPPVAVSLHCRIVFRAKGADHAFKL